MPILEGGGDMKIRKDDREWVVNLDFANTECPHLFYPYNIHGCALLQLEWEKDHAVDIACNMENCLGRNSKQHDIPDIKILYCHCCGGMRAHNPEGCLVCLSEGGGE